MNPVFEKGTIAQALSAHAVIGLCAGAILYLVCLTGTIVVFYEEWQRVEQPIVPEMTGVSPDAVQTAVTQILARDKEPTTHLYVHMPVEALPRATVMTDHMAFHMDAAGDLAVTEENAWSDFLLELHYALNLPAIVGLTIVGMTGVAILALSISGIVALPRIFRDAFRLRARNTGGVGLADWHNRLSVWTLPFSLAIALTGAVIGLAFANAYGLAAGFYDGDVEAVYAPIFGAESAPDPTVARAPDVAAALRDMENRFPAITPFYVVIHDPLTAGQHVQVIGSHTRRLIFGEYYNYDAQGRFQGTSGLADGRTGQQVAASMYNLHFGNFGGLTVKILYFIFGLALTAIVATGVYIWLGKRWRQGIAHPRILNLWDGVVWGIPLTLAVTFVARVVVGNQAPLIAIFWSLTVLTLVVSATMLRLRLRGPLQMLLGLGLVAGGLAAFVV